jgi:hypothetical protein
MHLPSSRLGQAGTFTLPSGIEIDLTDPPSPKLRGTGMAGVEEDLLASRH